MILRQESGKALDQGSRHAAEWSSGGEVTDHDVRARDEAVCSSQEGDFKVLHVPEGDFVAILDQIPSQKHTSADSSLGRILRGGTEVTDAMDKPVRL